MLMTSCMFGYTSYNSFLNTEMELCVCVVTMKPHLCGFRFTLALLLPVGFILCSGQLSAPGASDLWKLALQDGYAVTLHRDEYMLVHGLFESLLSQSKDKA